MYQMSIWDYLTEESLETIPEEVMAKRIGDAIGVVFTRDNFFEDYRAKVGKWTLSVNYSRYFASVDDNEGRGARFISCDYQSNHSGKGAPLDSIEEAIEWFMKNRGGNNETQGRSNRCVERNARYDDEL